MSADPLRFGSRDVLPGTGAGQVTVPAPSTYTEYGRGFEVYVGQQSIGQFSIDPTVAFVAGLILGGVGTLLVITATGRKIIGAGYRRAEYVGRKVGEKVAERVEPSY